MTNTTSNILARASAAALVGEMQAAHALYEEAIQLAPDHVGAWLGLAGVVQNPDDKRACFEHVLRLDADNREAKAGLELLTRRAQMPTRRDEEIPAADPSIRALVANATRQLAERKIANATGTLPEPDTEEKIYCVNHPTTETLLRCNRCGRPVCTRCVKLTDVGYRCKDCISQQQSVYFNAEILDYPVAFVVCFIVCAVGAPLASLLLGNFGFFGWFIAFLAGSAAGGALAEIIRFAVRRRRGRYLWVVALAGILLGVLFGNVLLLFIFGLFPLFSIVSLVFLGLALSTTYFRLR